MPHQDRRTTQGTSAGGGVAPDRGPSSGSNALIEMVLSWGAAADPAAGDLLGALTGFDDEVLSLLRTFRQKGPNILPAPLLDQICKAGTSLPAAGSTRLNEILENARDELVSSIERRRRAILSELKGWAAHMDFIQVTSLLERIWRTEDAVTTADQFGAADNLLEVQKAIDQVRFDLSGRVQALLASSSGKSAPANLATEARGAIEKGDPRELSRALHSLGDLGSRENRRDAEESWRQARASLEATCARARESQGTEGRAPAGGLNPLLAEALREAERALGAGAPLAAPGLESGARMLTFWDKALGGLLDGSALPAEDVGKARQALAEALQRDIARHVALDLGIQDQNGKIPEGDFDATAKKLLEVAVSGGGSFQQAFDNALALARKIRGRSETRLRETAARLRAAAGEMTALLDKTADQLPTARVVQARLWLDQLEGIIASGEIPSMDSLAGTISDDLKEIGQLLDLIKKRKHSREASERESLKVELARLLKAANGGAAAKIKTLAGQVEKAEMKSLGSLREQIDRVGGELERSVRLEAGRALYDAGRLLPDGGKPAGAVAQKLIKLDELAGALRGAMERDDLFKIVSLGREVRAAVSVASPMSRPVVRIAMAAAGVLVVTGGLIAWRYSSDPDRPQSYHLTLAGTEQQTVDSVWLAREGEFVQKRGPVKGNETVNFDLAPGRYEVYVNEKYTGQVIQVPGTTDVGDIPVP